MSRCRIRAGVRAVTDKGRGEVAVVLDDPSALFLTGYRAWLCVGGWARVVADMVVDGLSVRLSV